MKHFLLVFIVFFSLTSYAEIYRCVDENGETTFSDQKCDSAEDLTDSINSKVNAFPFDEKVELEDAKLKVIYEGSNTGTNSRFLRVSIYEETETYIIFFVEGYYRKVPGGKAEFRVSPNIHWSARTFSTTESGKVSGYARVGLGSKSPDTAESDIITLQLWEYRNNKTHGILETKVVPFKKKWVKK